jgi:hypothetical protein
MLKKVSIPKDPTKSAFLICKRMILFLKELQMDVESSLDKLSHEGSVLTESITTLLTRVYVQNNFIALKRLHLTPGNLKRAITAVRASRSERSIQDLLNILTIILQDLDAIRLEIQTQQTTNNSTGALPSVTLVKKSLPSQHSAESNALSNLNPKLNLKSCLKKNESRNVSLDYIEHKTGGHEIEIQDSEQIVTEIKEEQSNGAPFESDNKVDVLLMRDGVAVKRKWHKGTLENFKKFCNVENDNYNILIQHSVSKHRFLLENVADVTDGCLVIVQKSQQDQIQRLETKIDIIKDFILKSDFKPRKSTGDFVNRLKNQIKEFSSIKSDFKELKSSVTLALSEVAGQINKMSIIDHTNQKISEPDILEKIIKNCYLLSKEVQDYSHLLENTRLDLTRGCRPPSNFREYIIQKQKDLETDLSLNSEILKNIKKIRKAEWENSLQTILQEQKSVQDSLNLMEVSETELNEQISLLNSITPILDYHASHPKRAKTVQFEVWNPEISASLGYEYLLNELKLKEIDKDRSFVLDIVEANKRTKVTEMNPMLKELKDFINKGKFTNRGGLQKVDNLREEATKKFLKENFQNKQLS